MRVGITGSHGFIGAHLGNKLVMQGVDVLGIDDMSHASDQQTIFNEEHESFDKVIKGEFFDECDAIIHLAADINVDESIKQPLKYLRNNAIKTTEVLEYLYLTGWKGKFIYASSAEVYGNAQMPRMNEDHPLDPLSPYAVSKLSAEQMCKNFAQLYGMDITIIRNFNTFGEFQRGGLYGGVIAKFKEQAKSGQDITVYGSGEQMRDYMHISQAIDGYILALEAKLPLIVNFGSGTPIKIIDIANFIANEFGGNVVHTKSRPNEIMRLEADVTRAVRCGYNVKTDFWQNLEDYLHV